MTTIYHTRDLDKLPQDFYLFGYGANIHPTSEYRNFQQMWKKVRKIIYRNYPKSSKPARASVGRDGIIRGYKLDEPWSGDWCRPELWRKPDSG